MSYEDSTACRLLNTHCCACGRPLVDAISVQHGMGPDCRAHYMVPTSPEQDANRQRANEIVYDLSQVISSVKGGDLDQVGRHAVADKLRALGDLGFNRLADKLLHRWVQIRVYQVEPGRLVVHTPYSERVVALMRRIPGRRWEEVGAHKYNTFPVSARRAVWNVLKACFPGFAGVNQDGAAFVVPSPETVGESHQEPA